MRTPESSGSVSTPTGSSMGGFPATYDIQPPEGQTNSVSEGADTIHRRVVTSSEDGFMVSTTARTIRFTQENDTRESEPGMSSSEISTRLNADSPSSNAPIASENDAPGPSMFPFQAPTENPRAGHGSPVRSLTLRPFFTKGSRASPVAGSVLIGTREGRLEVCATSAGWMVASEAKSPDRCLAASIDVSGRCRHCPRTMILVCVIPRPSVRPSRHQANP